MFSLCIFYIQRVSSDWKFAQKKTTASPFTLALKRNFLKEVAGCGIIRNTVELPRLRLLISSNVMSEFRWNFVPSRHCWCYWCKTSSWERNHLNSEMPSAPHVELEKSKNEPHDERRFKRNMLYLTCSLIRTTEANNSLVNRSEIVYLGWRGYDKAKDVRVHVPQMKLNRPNRTFDSLRQLKKK